MSSTRRMLPQAVIEQSFCGFDFGGGVVQTQQQLQQQLDWSPDDFMKRLYFIVLQDANPNNNNNNNKIPWPCIKFDNMLQCETIIKKRGILKEENDRRMLIRATLNNKNPQNPLVFLFGNRIPHNERVIVLNSDNDTDSNNDHQDNNNKKVELLDLESNIILFYTNMRHNQDFVDAMAYIKTFYDEAVEQEQQQQQQQQKKPSKTPAPTATAQAAAPATTTATEASSSSSSSLDAPMVVSPGGSSVVKPPPKAARITTNPPPPPSDKARDDKDATDHQRRTTESAASSSSNNNNNNNTSSGEASAPTIAAQDLDASEKRNSQACRRRPPEAFNAAAKKHFAQQDKDAPASSKAADDEPQDNVDMMAEEEESGGGNNKDASDDAVSNAANVQQLQDDDVNMKQSGSGKEEQEDVPSQTADDEDSNKKKAEQQQASEEAQSSTNEEMATVDNDSTQQKQPALETNILSTSSDAQAYSGANDTTTSAAQECVTTPKMKRAGAKKKPPPQSTCSSKSSSSSSLASSKKPPKQVDEEELVKFDNIKAPLKRAGFIFRKNLYCHPGMDPGTNATAMEGRDYFTSEESFRRHLCAYGLDASDKWTTDEREEIETWVRYTIYDFPDSQKIMPVYDDIKPHQVWGYLKKLGFRHAHCKLGGERWNFPAFNDGRDLVLGKTSFAEQNDLWTHLVRFGFPENSNFESITDADRIRLIYSLIWNRVNKGAVDTFRKLHIALKPTPQPACSKDDDDRPKEPSPPDAEMEVVGKNGQQAKEKLNFETHLTSNDQTAGANGPSSSQGMTTPMASRGTKRKHLSSTSSSKSSCSLTSSRKAPKQIGETKLFCFDEVKSPLERAGFIFRENLYCHPGMDPEKNAAAVQDRDYFTNERAFRRNLCAYGLNASDKWSDEEHRIIEMWVRDTIYEFPDSRKTRPVYQEPKIWPCLSDIGFTHAYSGIGGERYSFPPFYDGRDGILGQTCFAEESHLRTHLVRFGFPENCRFENISEAERVGLISCMIKSCVRTKTINTFQRVDPDVICESSSSSLRSAKKRKLSPGTSEYAHAADDATTSSDSASFITARQTEISPARGRRISLSPPFRAEAQQNLPVFTGTDREKLNACLDALSPSSERFSLQFDASGSSIFSKNLEKIDEFLTSAVASKGRHGTGKNDPAALYVCGAPGIGKTSGIKWCCDQLLRANGNSSKAKVLVVNAGHMQTGKSESSFCQQLAPYVGLKSSCKMDSITKKLKSNLVVVVVDEIDLLLSDSATDVDEPSATENEMLVKKLLDWANDRSRQFVLIGISNSSGNSKYARLQQLGKFQETITFTPYSESEIQGIIEARVGKAILKPDALRLIATKVAKRSGDIRKAFEMTSHAIQECLEKTPEGASSDGYLVTTMHVVLANKRYEEDGRNYSRTIDGLPLTGKVVLCVLTTIAKEHQGTLSLHQLKDAVESCLNITDRVDEVLPTSDFLTILEMLCDQGLLCTADNSSTNFSQAVLGDVLSAPIELKHPLQDVEMALEKELKHSFYEALREKAQNKAQGMTN